MDARVHHLQGKAERVKPADLLALLRDFYAEKCAQRARHEANARAIRVYDFNNTYQYVINREDAHLSWLREAIESMGGGLPAAAADVQAPPRAGTDATAETVRADAQATQALVERWQGRFDAVTDARHRLMLTVILGEMREHQRFFEQADAGRTDLLGRRTIGSEPVGGVLPARWVE
jgi:rubrerythrin